MGIYIFGMEMPKNHRHMILMSNGDITDLDGKTIAKAIKLPPHGRCIDADKLGKSVQTQAEIVRKWGIDELTEIADLIEKGFLQEVENADTIIPADPKKEDT